jgi:hypothetical protein
MLEGRHPGSCIQEPMICSISGIWYTFLQGSEFRGSEYRAEPKCRDTHPIKTGIIKRLND